MQSKQDIDRPMGVSKKFRNDTSGFSTTIFVTSDVSAHGVDYPTSAKGHAAVISNDEISEDIKPEVSTELTRARCLISAEFMTKLRGKFNMRLWIGWRPRN
jgi:hypothetical protein